MLKLILEAFISISEITAASGIVYHDNQLHIVKRLAQHRIHRKRQKFAAIPDRYADADLRRHVPTPGKPDKLALRIGNMPI